MGTNMESLSLHCFTLFLPHHRLVCIGSMDFFINSQKLQSCSCREIVRMQARVCKKRAGTLPSFPKQKLDGTKITHTGLRTRLMPG